MEASLARVSPTRGRPLPHRTAIENDFIQHLKGKAHTPKTISIYSNIVARFLKHIGNVPVNQVTEDLMQSFFSGIKGTSTIRCRAVAVSQFLSFAVLHLPVPVSENVKELALRQHWEVDKLMEKKEASADLITKLARKVIDHYLYFQARIKGEVENLDDIYRFAEECKELIEANLPLFMTLSAQGRNIHPKIDERVNP